MSFVVYDLTFLVIFCAILFYFLYFRRKEWKREGPFILYRTRLGIKAINYLGSRYKNFLKKTEWIIIAVGYFLMVTMMYFLFQLVYLFFAYPQFVKIVKIPPIAPLIPYLPQMFKATWLPPFYFTYWIIVLAIAAISHEFFHGIFAKARNIKIKSTGFAFLGPFIAAFVEPDEKKIEKMKIRDQLGFLSAGTFANVLMTIIFFFIMMLSFGMLFVPAGATFNTYTYSAVNASDVSQIGGSVYFDNLDGGVNLTKIFVGDQSYYVLSEDIQNSEKYELLLAFDDSPALNSQLSGAIAEFDGKKITSYPEFSKEIALKRPGDQVIIKTILSNESEKEYNVTLAARKDNSTRAFLGVGIANPEARSLLAKIRDGIMFFKEKNTYYQPRGNVDIIIFFYDLLWWIVLINMSVALMNMLPVGIFDGGRVFYLTVLGVTKSKKTAEFASRIFTYLLILIALALTFLWILKI